MFLFSLFPLQDAAKERRSFKVQGRGWSVWHGGGASALLLRSGIFTIVDGGNQLQEKEVAIDNDLEWQWVNGQCSSQE